MTKQIFSTLIFIGALFLPSPINAIVFDLNNRQVEARHLQDIPNQSMHKEDSPSTKTKKPKLSTEKKQKIWHIAKWVLGGIVGILLIYFLQGQLLLALVAGIVLTILNLKKFASNRPSYPPVDPSNPLPTNPTEVLLTDKIYSMYAASMSLRHPANKWTRRSLTRFFSGLGSIILGFFLAVGAGNSLGISLALFSLIFGLIMMAIGASNAGKALRLKEPRRQSTLIVVVLSITFGALVLLILSGGIFA